MRERMASILARTSWLSPAVGQFVEDVAEKGCAVDGAKNGGGFADGDGAAAEGFDRQAHLGQRRGGVQKAGGVGGGEIDDLGYQQGLGADASLGLLAFQAFVDEAFVGGVLVYDDDAAWRSGQRCNSHAAARGRHPADAPRSAAPPPRG